MSIFDANEFGASVYEASDREMAAFTRLPANEFVALAEMILELAGNVETIYAPERRVYEDLVVRISSRVFRGERELEVERIANDNPTTMWAEKAGCYRHHGEHVYLVPHMRSLVKRLLADRDVLVAD